MINLRAGNSSLQLAPEHGGAIVDWRFAHRALLKTVRGIACFPMVPYANRIALGKFKSQGMSHQVPLNFGDHPHSIHGIGWQRPWKVEGSGTDNARLTLSHDGFGAWPLPFTAEQYFELGSNTLRIELRVTNRADRPAPVGLGLHPYFRRTEHASLRFAAASVWLNDPTALPVSEVAVPDLWNHAGGKPVGSAPLDNCFSGWDGHAELDLGATKVTIEASKAFRHLQVYTPEGQDFFCVEPVTHRPNGVNAINGITVLPPGETLSGAINFHMTDSTPG